MKGHIRERSPGRWLLKYDAGTDPATGRRVQRYETIKGSKKDAQRRLRAILTAIDEGRHADPGRLTVKEYLARWLTDHARHAVSAKTFERYTEIVDKHLVPALGAHRLAKMAPSHVQAYLGQALSAGRRPRPRKAGGTLPLPAPSGLSALTVKHHYRVLSQALRQAVKLQLLARNVCDSVDPPRGARKEMAILDQKQAAGLLRAVEGLVIHTPVLLAVTTGLRRGEILGLRWRDVDLAAGTLSVVQALEQTADGITFKPPKTARSRRTITLPALTVEALRKHKAAQAAERLRLGPLWQDNDLVCPRFDGAPMSPRELTKAFARLARKLKLPVRFHDLRHTHISHLLAAGVHPKVASERAGHASISITLDVYSHVLPGLQEDAARKIDAALRTALEQ